MPRGTSITPEAAWLPWLPMPVAQYRFVAITDFRAAYQEGYKELPPRVQYLAWGNEVCPETNRPHLQAFAYGEKMSVKAWADIFGSSHVEPMYGSILQNERYCSKQSSLKELGLKPLHSGQKRCLVDFTDAILRNPKRAAVELAVEDADAAPVYVQYHRGLDKLSSAALERTIKGDFSAPEVYYVFGPPGSGKTRFVREREPDVYDVPSDDNYKWKDGYHGHEAVLFDNISSRSFASHARFLKELDRYPVRVPVKGGFVMWKPKRIYITALEEPDVFAKIFDHPLEFQRRLTTVVQLPSI